MIGLGVLDPIDLPSTTTLSPAVSPPQAQSSPPQPAPPPPTAQFGSSSFLTKFKRLGFKPAPVLKPATSPPPPTIGQAVLPLFPEAAEGGDAGRPKSVSSVHGVRRQGYVFAVRKWTRRDLEGPAGAQAATEVRLEWRRARRRGASASNGQQVNSAGSSPEGSTVPLPPVGDSPPNLKPPAMERQSSGDFLAPATAATTRAHRSNSLNGDRPDLPTRSPCGSPASSVHQDDGYESDPEDSDRPWSCEVVYGPPGGERRLLLGMLRPVPLHPRLIAHLAVPFTLAPISLGHGIEGGLSVEEMKDCLSSSALWIIVRENLGGLNNRRKGRG